MARHGYVRLQVQYSCTEKWSMARTDRSPRDSRCDVSMGGGRRGGKGGGWVPNKAYVALSSALSRR